MTSGKAGILLALGALGFSAPLALAGPLKIILIRHGEKPLEAMGSSGDKGLTGLDPAGEDRAIRLVKLFSKENAPDVIYAMRPGGGDESTRPHDTVKPLSDALGYPESDPSRFNNQFTVDQLVELAKDVLSSKNDGKTVLICWEHKRLLGDPKKKAGSIAAALGYPSRMNDFEHPKWGRCDFDRMVILNFAGDRLKSLAEARENIAGAAQLSYAADCKR